MLMLGLYNRLPSAGGSLLLDCTPYVTACKLSTNEHGFEGLTATIDQSLIEAFRLYDQANIYVGLYSDGLIIWEGRLEDPTLDSQRSGSAFTVQALGYWRALSDDRYTALWSKSTVEGFRPVTTDEHSAFLPERFQFDTQNRLFITPTKGSTQGNTGGPHGGGLAFFAPDRGTRDIVGVQFLAEVVTPGANWRAIAQTRDANFSTVVDHWTLTSTGAGTTVRAVHATFSSSARTVVFFFDFQGANTTYTGESGSTYLKITNLRLVTSTTNRVNTSLTANLSSGSNVTATVGSTAGMYVGQQLVIDSGNANSEMVTVISIGSATQFNADFTNNHVSGQAVQGFRVLADEIVRDVVGQISTLNPEQLSSSTSQIQSPGLDLLDESYEDVIPADVLTHLVGLGDNQSPPRRWECGVYEGRELYFRPQLTANRAWYVDASELSVARTLEQLANAVYATYQDSSGRTLRTSDVSDTASVTRYGITRRTVEQTQTTSSTQATVQANTALQDRKSPAPRAPIRFDAVYSVAGARYPLWMVRAGDTITIRNLSPGISLDVDRIRTFRLTHTTYDVMADTLDVEPEIPPTSLEVMLARRAEGIR